VGVPNEVVVVAPGVDPANRLEGAAVVAGGVAGVPPKEKPDVAEGVAEGVAEVVKDVVVLEPQVTILLI